MNNTSHSVSPRLTNSRCDNSAQVTTGHQYGHRPVECIEFDQTVEERVILPVERISYVVVYDTGCDNRALRLHLTNGESLVVYLPDEVVRLELILKALLGLNSNWVTRLQRGETEATLVERMEFAGRPR